MISRQHAFSLKYVEDCGRFSGYASVFHILDAHKDEVLPGAFEKSLGNWRNKGRLPKMLWQHDTQTPIGLWTHIDEDERGLYVEGTLLLDLPKGKEAYTLLKAGVIDELSIGFRLLKSQRKETHRQLTEIDLQEISLVTFAANTQARIETVKEVNSSHLLSSENFCVKLRTKIQALERLFRV